MKPTASFLSVASVISLLPTAKALVGSSWTVTNVPSTGLTDITFPPTIVEADHISGYYFAQQFGFVNSADVGYTGLQPRPNQNGKPVLHGVHRPRGCGNTTTDSNCAAGADGGPGVSCSVEWNGVYGRTYDLEVKRNGSSVWADVTHARIHIGSYTLPAGVGGIQSSQAGFVEWYPWNGGEPPNHCARLPYQKTLFGHPYTTRLGSVGTESLAYEYGDCVGQVAFKTEKLLIGAPIPAFGTHIEWMYAA
ncbi:hypothetical protein B0H16DRAFT_1796864 [Mycena metata]|uniref:Secreted protein n=1 Tax=Mycena metata TaxID=1033252 RepID=A0AAD7HEZ7_9AGAR|nr:hypothetical protein B0H16DRAFT_1796864 [Mycena metata]